jgi:large subunit ribosomal protein L18
MSQDKKLVNRLLRKQRVRATVSGTSERPRLSIFISNLHVSAQLIDDTKQHTLASATSVGTKGKATLSEQAAAVGADIAKKAKAKKVTKVVFDRNGRQYAGRLKALADAARHEGLEF